MEDVHSRDRGVGIAVENKHRDMGTAQGYSVGWCKRDESMEMMTESREVGMCFLRQVVTAWSSRMAKICVLY